jgi:hypothetical protein
MVYIFRHAAFSSAGDTIVCAAPRDLVISTYRRDGINGAGGLVTAFSGAALFRNEEAGSSYLGVWGKRNASRFRTALRAHAELNLIYAAPPARLVWYETRNARPIQPGRSG